MAVAVVTLSARGVLADPCSDFQEQNPPPVDPEIYRTLTMGSVEMEQWLKERDEVCNVAPAIPDGTAFLLGRTFGQALARSLGLPVSAQPGEANADTSAPQRRPEAAAVAPEAAPGLPPIAFPPDPPRCPQNTTGVSLVATITPDMVPRCETPTFAASFYKQACDRRNAVGCERLGYLYRDGIGVTSNLPRALSLFRQSCDAGLAAGCTDVGDSYRDGRGVAPNPARAATFYELGCKRGEARACYDLGSLNEEGQDGVPKNADRAAQLYAQACKAAYGTACNSLGAMLEHLANDFEQAGILYRRACEQGEPSGCANLGWLYETGQGGVPQDVSEAARLYAMGCKHGSAVGCTGLGHLNELGKGVPRDLARAASLYARGCEGGNAFACEQRKRLSGTASSDD